MAFIRSFLTLFGFICLLAIAFVAFQTKSNLSNFHPQAASAYSDMFTSLLETQSAPEAMVWKIPVEEGVSREDVEDAMMAVATEYNINAVFDLPLSQDIEAKTGKPYRFVKIYNFCRSRTAAVMMDHNDAYAAFMPCRVALVEDKQGKNWLYSMNMDLMIYGGAPLPPELEKQAISVKDTMLAIMTRGAAGEF